MMLKKLRKRQILLFICMLNVTLVFSQEIADNDVLQSALEKGALAADYWIKRSGKNPGTTDYYADICSYYGACIFGDVSGDSSNYNLINSQYKRTSSINTVNIDENSCGILPLHLYLHNGNAQHLKLGIDAADANIRSDGHFRNAIDDTYMTGSLLVQAFRATEDTKYLDFCVNFILRYMSNLQQSNGLYWHHWEKSHQFWGRGNGWGAASTAELLQVLPETHPKYNDILTGFKNHMAGLINVQLESGMWPQLLGSTDSRNWEETSGTSMFVFALFTGLELGILDEETYLEPAKKGWNALVGYLSSDGKLNNVAEGFWPRVGDANEYLNASKAAPGNSHGTAGFIWAETAIVKYYQGTSDGFRISVDISGRGIVSKDPDMRSYPKDTTVVLTATPRSGWSFTGWSGDKESSENPITVTVDTDISLNAGFERTGVDTTEQVINGQFESESELWVLNIYGGSATGSVVNGEYKINISSSGSNDYDVQLAQAGLYLENGRKYRLRFDAYAESSRNMGIKVGQADEPYKNYLNEPADVSLTTASDSFSIEFEMTEPTDENARIEFNAGGQLGDVFIDNVSLKEISTTSVMIPVLTKGKYSRPRITSSGITFDNSWNDNIDIRIYDISGRLVYRKAFADTPGKNSIRFDRVNFAKGLYIAKVYNNKTVLHSEMVHLK